MAAIAAVLLERCIEGRATALDDGDGARVVVIH